MKRIIIASALFSAVGMFAVDMSNTPLTGNLTKESLDQKSLEEVQGLYKERLSELKLTVASKKWQKRNEELVDLYAERAKHVYNCNCSQTYILSWFKGSPEDCIKVQEVDQDIRKQYLKIAYAHYRVLEASPDLKDIEKSLLEKEYEAIEIS